VQAAVLDLLTGLRRELGLALRFITHDLAVVAAIADRALLLERGRVREERPVAEVLRRPADPDTAGAAGGGAAGGGDRLSRRFDFSLLRHVSVGP
jgi:ABC-type glutathione transport system ATPase component